MIASKPASWEECVQYACVAEETTKVPAAVVLAHVLTNYAPANLRFFGHNPFDIPRAPRHSRSHQRGGIRFAAFSKLSDAFSDYAWLLSQSSRFADAWESYLRALPERGCEADAALVARIGATAGLCRAVVARFWGEGVDAGSFIGLATDPRGGIAASIAAYKAKEKQ